VRLEAGGVVEGGDQAAGSLGPGNGCGWDWRCANAGRAMRIYERQGCGGRRAGSGALVLHGGSRPDRRIPDIVDPRDALGRSCGPAASFGPPVTLRVFERRFTAIETPRRQGLQES